MDKPQIICHVEKGLNCTLFDVKWIPCSAKLVVLGSKPRGTGFLQVFEICQGDVQVVKEHECHKALKCGTFGASTLQQRNLATGDFDGRLQVWDLEQMTPSVYSAKAHEGIINAIDGIGGLNIGQGAPEIVTGGRDGSVKIWDVRQKDRAVAEMAPKEGETRRDCWTVAFGNSYNSQERIVCSGYDNGDVKMFDLRTMSLKWEVNLKNGVCCIEFDRRDIPMNKLLCTTLESALHVFDLRTQHPKHGFASTNDRAHKSTVWQGRHLPQNRDIFATTGGSGSICLWKYDYPEKRSEPDSDDVPRGVAGKLALLQNCTLGTQPVSAFQWSPDKLGLAACTAFDQALRLLIVTKLNLF